MEANNAFAHVFDIDPSLPEDFRTLAVLEKLEEGGYNYLIKAYGKYKKDYNHDVKGTFEYLFKHIFEETIKDPKSSCLKDEDIRKLIDMFTDSDEESLNWFVKTLGNDLLFKGIQEFILAHYLLKYESFAIFHKIITRLFFRVDDKYLIECFNNETFIHLLSFSLIGKDPEETNKIILSTKDYLLKRFESQSTKDKITERIFDIVDKDMPLNSKNLNNPMIQPKYEHYQMVHLYMFITKLFGELMTEEKFNMKTISSKNHKFTLFNQKNEEPVTLNDKYIITIISGFLSVYEPLPAYYKIVSAQSNPFLSFFGIGMSTHVRSKVASTITQNVINNEIFCDDIAQFLFKNYFSQLYEDNSTGFFDINIGFLNYSGYNEKVLNKLPEAKQLILDFYKGDKLASNVYERSTACSIILNHLTKKKIFDFTDDQTISNIIKGSILSFEEFTKKLSGNDKYLVRNRCFNILTKLSNLDNEKFKKSIESILTENEIVTERFILHVFDQVKSVSEMFSELQSQEGDETTSNRLINVIVFYSSLVNQVKTLVDLDLDVIKNTIAKGELIGTVLICITHSLKEYMVTNKGQIKHLSVEDTQYISVYYNTIKRILLIISKMREIEEFNKLLIEDDLFSSKFFTMVYMTLLTFGKMTDDENVKIGEMVSGINYDKQRYEQEQQKEDYIDPEEIPDEFKDPLTYVPIEKPTALYKNEAKKEYYIFDEKVIMRHLLDSGYHPYTREKVTIEGVKELNNKEEVKEYLESFMVDFEKWKKDYLSKKQEEKEE